MGDKLPSSPILKYSLKVFPNVAFLMYPFGLRFYTAYWNDFKFIKKYFPTDVSYFNMKTTFYKLCVCAGSGPLSPLRRPHWKERKMLVNVEAG